MQALLQVITAKRRNNFPQQVPHGYNFLEHLPYAERVFQGPAPAEVSFPGSQFLSRWQPASAPGPPSDSSAVLPERRLGDFSLPSPARSGPQPGRVCALPWALYLSPTGGDYSRDPRSLRSLEFSVTLTSKSPIIPIPWK